ncbi:hypothetical protein T07_5445 [Trichinella nelsoni]|uniref:Uncharacterized protein n=1 Tax=Trichinella nelsoni TaxID=6336 RepID=A0A0V0RMH0_9BILA|nr:hypothetical protein T07_5445 [Trichinella nelsoni]
MKRFPAWARRFLSCMMPQGWWIAGQIFTIETDLLDFENILPNKTKSKKNYYSSQVHSIMGSSVIFLQHCIFSA